MPDLQKLAEQAALESGFVLGKKIYSLKYYDDSEIRAIFEGAYQSQPAVLKVYNDPRGGSEAQLVEQFNKYNASKLIRGPKVFAAKTISNQSGWYISEQLAGGAFLKMPLVAADRGKFFELFLEYRRNFPEQSNIEKTLLEKLPAADFHLSRLARWLDLASSQEEQRAAASGALLLDAARFLPLYSKALQQIQRDFEAQKMIWCHGHFKPDELYALPGGTYVLNNFSRMHYYPESYEPAFIVWADWLMSADWSSDYAEWKQGIEDWLRIFSEKYDPKILRTALIERSLGTILADITASRPKQIEAEKRLGLLLNLLEDLLSA